MDLEKHKDLDEVTTWIVFFACIHTILSSEMVKKFSFKWTSLKLLRNQFFLLLELCRHFKNWNMKFLTASKNILTMPKLQHTREDIKAQGQVNWRFDFAPFIFWNQIGEAERKEKHSRAWIWETKVLHVFAGNRLALKVSLCKYFTKTGAFCTVYCTTYSQKNCKWYNFKCLFDIASKTFWERVWTVSWDCYQSEKVLFTNSQFGK